MPTWNRPDPDHKSFNCSFAWHHRKSGLYLSIYYLLAQLTTSGTNPFFSSIERVAKYFDANYETVRRVFKQLVKTGWLKHGDTPRTYLWVHHSEWEKTHPGNCCVRVKMVWDQDADPLVGKIYAIAGGKFHLFENHLVGMRKVAPSDAAILEHFTLAIAAANKRRDQGHPDGSLPKACWWQVHRRFKLNKKAADHDAKLARDVFEMEKEVAARREAKANDQKPG